MFSNCSNACLHTLSNGYAGYATAFSETPGRRASTRRPGHFSMPRRLTSCVHGPRGGIGTLTGSVGCPWRQLHASGLLLAPGSLQALSWELTKPNVARERNHAKAEPLGARSSRTRRSTRRKVGRRATASRIRSPLHEVDIYMQPRRAAAAGDLGAGPRPPVHAARRSEAAPRPNAALFAPSSARRRRPRPPPAVAPALDVEPGAHAPVARYQHEPRPLLACSPARRGARRRRGGSAGIRSHPARSGSIRLVAASRGRKSCGRNLPCRVG